MKITITNSDIDPSDDLVTFQLAAETQTHKTTLQFYGYTNTFSDFAEKLQKFPFETKELIKLEIGDWKKSTYGLMLLVELVDNAGHIKFTIRTRDNHNGELALFADMVEAMPLEDLANKLSSKDFTTKSELVWQS